MAYSNAQPTQSIVAATTFAKTDLYKFLELTTDAQVTIGATTSAHIVGTLLSVTGTTAGAGVETVKVGELRGVGKVFMAGSTRTAGQTVAASSAGFGVAPTTNQAAYGYALDGSSGSTGRIFSVLFIPSANL